MSTPTPPTDFQSWLDYAIATMDARGAHLERIFCEGGVTAALIHNHYPGIADAIREAQGRANRERRDAKNQELKGERQKTRDLRQEIASLRADIATLASINEVLMAENAVLKAKLKSPRVVEIRTS